MSLTVEQVKARIEEILRAQYADGEARQDRDGSTWGGPGADVKRAVAYASDALRPPEAGEMPSEYLESIISGIQQERGRYKDIESDRDGYGSGTFNEILRDVESIRRMTA